MRHVKRALALAGAYAALTLVMTQAMLNVRALGSAVYPGDARLIVWTLAWANHAVLDGVSLLNANIFYPAAESLQYTEHLVGISAFTLPIYAATRNPVLAYNVVWLLAFVLNALTMHLLAYRQTRNHAAAATAALVFTFSFYRMQQAHGHLAQIWTWLVPLSLWLLERWVERPSIPRALAWTVAVVLQSLGSWYVAVMVALANAIAIMWIHAATVRDRWRVRIAHLASAAIIGGAILWPLASPYRSLEPPPLQQVVALSADWHAYLIPPADTLVGRWWMARIGPGPRTIWGEATLFIGWIALALAAGGLAIAIRRRAWAVAGFATTCIVLGVALSFGPSVIDGVEKPSVFGTFASLPAMAGFRVPGRFALIVLLGIGLLAAEAVRTMMARFGRRAVTAMIVLWPLMLAEWFVISMPTGRPQPAPIPFIYRSAEVRNARAIVSLPVYRGTVQWWLEPDYMYYSTAHWRPIVNGYGRSEPTSHHHVISYMNAFPGPNNARKMRELGIEYIVLHGGAYPAGVDDVVREVVEGNEYELVLRIGTDYLIRVRPH